MLKTVLFDLDGTLTNSLPLIRRTYVKVFEEMNIEWGEDDVMRLIGLPLREIGHQFAGSERVEEFFNRYQHFYRREHDNCMEVFPGTVEMLAQLKPNYTLGIVTSKSRVGTEMTLDFLQLKHYFKAVITADDVEHHKPHRQPVEKALSLLNAAAENSVFIGDSPFDIESGNNASVTTIAVTWGMASIEELKKFNPNHVVNNQKQLTSLLLKLR